MAKRKRADLTAGKAQVIDDPREELKDVNESTKNDKDELGDLTSWVMARVDAWRQHRDTNYLNDWEAYERLWRGIWSGNEKHRSKERSKLITPGLSEAVENGVSEVEEAVFGRGNDFFEVQGDVLDNEIMKKATEQNKKMLREDMARTGFVTHVSESLVNAGVYGTGIAEIVLEDKEEREIFPVMTMGEDGKPQILPDVKERTVTYSMLRSVNPRNFGIDPNARDIESALGCFIEENVASHLINQGMRDGTYRKVELKSEPQDSQITADVQGVTPFHMDAIPTIRYYGKVPKHLLFPPGNTAKLVDNEEDPAAADMIEAKVVIVNKTACIKAEETTDFMQDRPVVAFRWDVIPGRFWGRGICEKGITPQKAADSEIRSRIDSLAYVSAPVMGIDAAKMPRGFKFEIYPGKSLLTNGDPATILKPFKFGQLEQATFPHMDALDKMLQRATGSVDGISMAQNGAGGDARSGAVSMSLAGIVKRNKRTLMQFIDNFLQPAIRKMMWRNMQYNHERYAPYNFSFNVTSTMGIMQREYEMLTLTQLLQSVPQGSPPQLLMLAGVMNNTGLTNRQEIIDQLKEMAKPQEAPPVDPAAVAPGLDPSQQMLNQARANESAARAGLIQAQAQTEAIKPQILVREVFTKGIYAEQDNAAKAFDARMKMADRVLKREDIQSNERITQRQVQGSLAKAAIGARAKAMPPQPTPMRSASPM